VLGFVFAEWIIDLCNATFLRRNSRENGGNAPASFTALHSPSTLYCIVAAASFGLCGCGWLGSNLVVGTYVGTRVGIKLRYCCIM